MRHFKCDLQMNCCFHEWEKTKLEVKLLVRRGISRNMGPKAVWKGSYFRQSSSKRETWGWVRELFFRCIASISTILLNCWWSWSIALEAFFLGQESTWHVPVTGGSSLLATGRCCQSVMSGLKLGRAHFLNGTEEATRGFTFKVINRIGNVDVRVRRDDFLIEMNSRTNEFCQGGNDSL